MLTDELTLVGIAATEACIRHDPGALRVLVDGTDPADFPTLVLFLSGGLARSLVQQYGFDYAGQLLAGARALVLTGWTPPPEQ